ncbi:alpha/beta fold hydrolase [Williamsia phyllosphaerae]|uniref:Hydrolase n=1 Tax=Williamsia phyllosphaerae TaxID=885042 RepID=A0ABQ1V4A2_9NOCA|nr:alpha/beta hydrolase [Williamsia phyllosphaerae]GGF36987.1 hydrolase [Williamsia phyllosphaerae]
MFSSHDEFATRMIGTNGVEVEVALAGPLDGAPLVLLHGWPHTWEVWRPVGRVLARNGFRVIAPNRRGIGGGDRPRSGYDMATLAADVTGLIDALDVTTASVVGIDAGVAPAFHVGLTAPDRVRRLVVMEGLLPGLPGAEAFLSAGPPWWFGFHAVPGLAETVLEGHEAEYLGWFLQGPSVRHDIGAQARSAFIHAHSGKSALRAGFEAYRATERNAKQISCALQTRRLTVPTLALAGGVVGDAIGDQLVSVADNLSRASIPGCGHIIPLERPDELAAAVADFVAIED